MICETRPPAPAHFIGIQDGFGDPPLELFTLTKPVGDHPVNSTVSRQTLERAGYEVPRLAVLLQWLSEHPRPDRTLASAF